MYVPCSVPLTLKGDYPDHFHIRGEIIILKEGFKKMNEQRIAEGEDPYMNPRNTASGSLKLQDTAEVAKRPLDCLLYYVVGDNLPVDNQFDSLQKARDWGVQGAFAVQAMPLHRRGDGVYQLLGYPPP